MIEALVSEIRAAARYRSDLDGLMFERLDQSLARKEGLPDPGEGCIERLVQSAGILSMSSDPEARREAFAIASSAYELYREELPGLADALTLVLSRLGNFPAIDFRAELRSELVHLPTPALLEAVGRRIGNTIMAATGEMTLTDYQVAIWNDAKDRRSVVASAPTSAGKSFLFQRIIVEAFEADRIRTAVIIVPTRALIAQVSASLAPLLKKVRGTPRVITVPLPQDAADQPRAYVMTQERLQAMLADPSFAADLVLVDEAHLVGEGSRGIILQSVVDELMRRRPGVQLLFTLPRVRNAAALAAMFRISDASIRRTDDSPVGQNIILLEVEPSAPDQVRARRWSMVAETAALTHSLPEGLVAPDQKLVYLSWFYGRGAQSIVYGDSQARCEKLAVLLADLVATHDRPDDDPRLAKRRDLAKFISEHIHPDYDLAKSVLNGIGYHYGNMPTLIRQAVEQAFDDRLLDFIVCTSTLLQGVNLPARNIFMHRPEKGKGNPLSPIDFWNLAGRAGRLGKEFEGNVFLVDYMEWDAKPLDKPTDGEIRSSMEEQVAQRSDELLSYIADASLATNGNSTLENTFARLFRDYRLNRIDQTFERLAVPADKREMLEAALKKASSQIEVSDETLSANAYVSPHRQQRLYAKLRRDLPKKGVDYYMPPHPAADWKAAQQKLIAVYRRLQVELEGKQGRSYIYWATLSLLWMRGQGLPDLIDYAIEKDSERVLAGRAEGGRQRPRASGSIIRKMLDDVEGGLRFRFVRQMSCYNSVLRQVLLETGHIREAEHIPAIPLFLEVGASSTTMLSFINLGLSRITARLLQSRAASYQMDLETALAWLRRQDLSSQVLPPVVAKEVTALLL